MIVVVGEHSVELKEAQDLEQLHVFSTCAPTVVDATLRSAGLGRMNEDGTALLNTTELHARAVQEGTGPDRDWERRWITMVRLALSQGQATDHGAGLVVRIEPDWNGEA
ncbi:hypothetical protein [Cryptosporangium sp. NPDC051539]|uniref:hypothetical protein n=1 Tax=Cryptosporangium sp. NPDC051539 TaxID=3363962 RepID=UPI003792A9F9